MGWKLFLLGLVSLVGLPVVLIPLSPDYLQGWELFGFMGLGICLMSTAGLPAPKCERCRVRMKRTNRYGRGLHMFTQFRCQKCGRGMSRSSYMGAAAGPSWGEPEEDYPSGDYPREDYLEDSYPEEGDSSDEP